MTLPTWGRFGVAQIRNRAVASNCLHQSPDVEAYGNLDPYARAPRFIGWTAFGNVALALSAVNAIGPHAALVTSPEGPKLLGRVLAPPLAAVARRACRLRGACGWRLSATALNRMSPAARVGELLVRRIGNGSVEPFLCPYLPAALNWRFWA